VVVAEIVVVVVAAAIATAVVGVDATAGRVFVSD
jgi:hypothetical protein